jgi:hypothetical protein
VQFSGRALLLALVASALACDWLPPPLESSPPACPTCSPQTHQSPILLKVGRADQVPAAGDSKDGIVAFALRCLAMVLNTSENSLAPKSNTGQQLS